jgi:hypothetical protein
MLSTPARTCFRCLSPVCRRCLTAFRDSSLLMLLTTKKTLVQLLRPGSLLRCRHVFLLARARCLLPSARPPAPGLGECERSGPSAVVLLCRKLSSDAEAQNNALLFVSRETRISSRARTRVHCRRLPSPCSSEIPHCDASAGGLFACRCCWRT